MPAAAPRSPLTLVTPRDWDLLLALDRCPLTVRQLLTLSRTFAYPFTTERRVQERLARLCAAGRVRRWVYATAGRGALGYYTLSPEGYRILHGEEAAPPTRYAFAEVGVARQHHTHSLADFIVHTAVATHRAGLCLRNFYRENALRLEVAGAWLYPDCSFQLALPGGRTFTYFVELDTGSERVRSEKDIDSWERKVRLYEAYRSATGNNFRVLAVATRGPQRLRHILEAAARLSPNPHRSLVYGTVLADYLHREDALTAACWQDHRGAAVALLGGRQTTPPVAASGNPTLSRSVLAAC